MRSFLRYPVAILSVAAVLVLGCGPQPARDASSSSMKQLGLAIHNQRNSASALGVAETANESSDVAGIDRQIIYEASINLVVGDFAKIDAALPVLLKQHGGYFAEVSVDRTSGEERAGRWVARVPVEQFEAFLDEVAKLGVPESRQQTAQDVTEEFVDLGARIANKKRLEERLVGHLEDSDGEVKDLVALERELSRVRGEVEQMQGRLNYLTNRTELTTVTISAREERDYVPPQAPTFTANITSAWGDSLSSLRATGESAVVAGVFTFPWLIVLAVVATPVVWGGRRLMRRTLSAGMPPRRDPVPAEPVE